MNNLTIKGRLTKKPQVKTTTSGKKVASFNVAVDTGFGESKKTDFFTVVAWDKKADFCEQYFDKGQEMLVQGEMHSREYDSKTYWEVTAQQIEFCGARTTPKPNVAVETSDFEAINDDAGDLPF